MSFGDLTTYIEVDPEDKLTVISDRITASGLERDQDAYVYKDKGVDFYDGDFSFEFYTFMDSSSDSLSNFYPFIVANQINNLRQLFLSDNTLSVDIQSVSSTMRVQLRQLAFGSTVRQDSAFLSFDTEYWHTVERIGGTLTDKIYSDQARTVLVDTLSINPTSIVKYRYEYPANALNIGGLIEKFNGYMGIELGIAAGNINRKLGKGLAKGLGRGLA